MMGDADIQLWLETEARTQSTVIVPYVRSTTGAEVRYVIALDAQSSAGRSRMSQGGKMTLESGKAHALGKLEVNLNGVKDCLLKVALTQYGVMPTTYDFSCAEILQSKKLR